MNYYKDTTKLNTIDDVLNKKFSTTKNIDISNFSKNVYWLKIDIKNCDGKKYILNIDNFLIDEIDLFFIKNSKVVKSYKTGVKYKNSTKGLTKYSKFAFPLDIKGNFSIYLRIESSFLSLPFIKILSNEVFLKKQNYNNMFNTAFYFSLTLMFFYNLCIFIVSKIRIYKFYLGYIFGIFGFLFFYDGYLNTLFFTEYPMVSELLFFIFYVIIFISVTKFSTLLFQSKRNTFLLHKILIKTSLVIVPIFASIGIILSFVNKDLIFLAQKYLLLCAIFVILLIITITVKYYRSKEEIISKIYSFIWIIFMIVSLLFAINMMFGFVDTNIMTKILKFNILLEIIAMSLFIAYRLKDSKEKNLRLKIKNKEQELFILRQTRLASFGEVINSIAHEWKQPLHRINMLSLDLETTYDKKGLTKEYLYNQLNEIELQTKYMNDTVNQFMDYFSPQKTKEEFYLIDCVNEAVNLLSIKFSKNLINYKIDCIDENIKTIGYKKEYIQCIIILINNAIDAILNQKVSDKYIYFKIDKFGNRARLSIIDNAGGIKVEPIDKIFEPNVSTKASNTNSGVGLFIAKKIIEDNMNKKLTCENYNDGAKFCIIG
ncbi:sensor histidine kinase [Arcobacter sp. CECT 8986]|uniref:sensor histidine kinase n=1 Tax=Arcobacter sp. CECT 8986 TaxID=2044507 RepID=UPI002159C793|nr:sensor histidine kinase [Arcobacter sp. CECT 8986]